LLVLCALALLGLAYQRAGIDPPANAELYRGVDLRREAASGASDPSWSPDGREVAFSLAGSLWRMAADGGDAVQVTSAPGYDAGAAWSPDGKQIAFVRGAEPIRGCQLGTQGRLMVIDLASGAERVLASDLEFIGTPAWAGNDAVLANSSSALENNLLWIPAGEGTRRRLTGALSSRVSKIMQRGRGWFYYWYPAALHPSGTELVFGGDRDGTGQLWRMPLKEGLVVTEKLTPYQESDQAEIQDVAWENNTTLLYSANLQSGGTNFELWRWEGGRTRQLTNTLQDEFSPRPSPDGKRLLFVSNYLGSTSLFVADANLERATHIPVRGLRFRKGSRSLRVRTQNGDGQVIPSRISIRGSDGKFYAPLGAMARRHAGMGDAAGFYFSKGEDVVDVPAGPARVAAFHGFEHEPAVSEGSDPEVTLTLRRRLQWQGAGWWSGEDHIHANYAGPYYLRPPDARLMIDAEDLNVGNFLVANAEGARAYDREFFEGKPHSLSTPERILYWNQEFRNRIVYGHMALLHLTRLVEPMYTSFEGTPQPWDYPSNTMIAAQARRDKAVVAYVHPVVGLTRDPFDFTVSAKELPVTAALGLVDAVDIYPWGPVAAEIWHSLLNCGFRIAPGAGTDTFSNWRNLNQVPGNSRIYVRSAEPLSYAGWIEGMRNGRSFVSNGPLMKLAINGMQPGDTIDWKGQEPLRIEAVASATAQTTLRKIELLFNGKVVASRESDSANSLELRWEGTAPESGWMAARCEGAPSQRSLGAAAQAHTAPVYLRAGGRPMRPRREDAQMFMHWIDRLQNLIAQRNNFQTAAQRKEVDGLVEKARRLYADAAR
jgi:Tol biopolymer transport system component